MNTIKKSIEELYSKELKNIYNKLGKGVTYGDQLNKYATSLFGNKFKGVYAADELEPLKRFNTGYFIYNLDDSDEPGSHWIAVIKHDSGILVYDSFARSTKLIAPNLYAIGNVKDTEYDAEQSIYQDDCGSRFIAAIKIYYEFGQIGFSFI